jgi:hypothetical protein
MAKLAEWQLLPEVVFYLFIIFLKVYKKINSNNNLVAISSWVKSSFSLHYFLATSQMLPSEIITLIFEYKNEIESLIAVTQFLNCKYEYLGLKLHDRSDIDEFLSYTEQTITARNLTIYHNCSACRSVPGMRWFWVSDNRMRILDVINFAGTRMCPHEELTSINIQNNYVCMYLNALSSGEATTNVEAKRL